MTKQTLSLLIHNTEIEDLRKALKVVKGYSDFEINETIVPTGGIQFNITSENPMVFFYIGESFGIIKEFKSKKF